MKRSVRTTKAFAFTVAAVLIAPAVVAQDSDSSGNTAGEQLQTAKEQSSKAVEKTVEESKLLTAPEVSKNAAAVHDALQNDRLEEMLLNAKLSKVQVINKIVSQIAEIREARMEGEGSGDGGGSADLSEEDVREVARTIAREEINRAVQAFEQNNQGGGQQSGSQASGNAPAGPTRPVVQAISGSAGNLTALVQLPNAGVVEVSEGDRLADGAKVVEVAPDTVRLQSPNGASTIELDFAGGY